MSLDSVRETVSTLRESREAIRDGRVAIADAKLELRARYDRAQRRLVGIDHAIELLRRDGPDTDLRQLTALLDGDRNGAPSRGRRAVGDDAPSSEGSVTRLR